MSFFISSQFCFSSSSLTVKICSTISPWSTEERASAFFPTAAKFHSDFSRLLKRTVAFAQLLIGLVTHTPQACTGGLQKHYKQCKSYHSHLWLNHGCSPSRVVSSSMKDHTTICLCISAVNLPDGMPFLWWFIKRVLRTIIHPFF